MTEDEALAAKFRRQPLEVVRSLGLLDDVTDAEQLQARETFHMSQFGLYFYDRSASPDVLLIKTISTLRPHHFGDAFPKEKSYFDEELQQQTLSIDFSHMFWRQKLDSSYIEQLLTSVETSSPVSRAIDRAAFERLSEVRHILATSAEKMPDANTMKFCYRVLLRILDIINRFETGIAAHQSRGFVPTDFNPYSLEEVCAVAMGRRPSAASTQLASLLEFVILPPDPKVAIFDIRNDVEFFQAAVLARMLKSKFPKLATVLETAGANEQFDFSNWVDVLSKNTEVPLLFDYFVPKQDYRATLVPLVTALVGAQVPELQPRGNAVRFGVFPPASTKLVVDEIDVAFARHRRCASPFRAAGRRTFITRLSPARCHWSACSFCTINSQHVVPSGKKEFDEPTQLHAAELIQLLREREIESIVLTDEAIHPKVLLAFAQLLVESGVNVVYRARSRFTDDLTAEACELLAASGCRYLGMGLESATPRVNALFNKHHGPSPNYENILANLERAGIPPHIYAILGFPTENRREIEATRDFLIAAIERHRYVTVSANNFYLMKGSAVAKNPARWGIELTVEYGELSLTLDFVEQQYSENREYAALSAQKIYATEFCPDGDADADFAEGFWHFIDQSGIFYTQKTIYADTPYRRRPPVDGSTGYEISPFFFIDYEERGESVSVVCGWIGQKYVRVDAKVKELLEKWAADAVRRVDSLQVFGVEVLSALQSAGILLPVAESEQASTTSNEILRPENSNRPPRAKLIPIHTLAVNT